MKSIKSIYNSKTNSWNLYHCPGQLVKPEEPLQKRMKDAANLEHRHTSFPGHRYLAERNAKETQNSVSISLSVVVTVHICDCFQLRGRASRAVPLKRGDRMWVKRRAYRSTDEQQGHLMRKRGLTRHPQTLLRGNRPAKQRRAVHRDCASTWIYPDPFRWGTANTCNFVNWKMSTINRKGKGNHNIQQEA